MPIKSSVARQSAPTNLSTVLKARRNALGKQAVDLRGATEILKFVTEHMWTKELKTECAPW